jgi:hypothetical protein
MPFSPNSGYAFAVADNTWHSADPVGQEVKTRDSILLTYFVDAGPWRFVRNRGRRAANFALNELRNLKHAFSACSHWNLVSLGRFAARWKLHTHASR